MQANSEPPFTIRNLGVIPSEQPVDPRRPTGLGGTRVLEPKSFRHDHMTPTEDFAQEDSQQKNDACDLDEMLATVLTSNSKCADRLTLLTVGLGSPVT